MPGGNCDPMQGPLFQAPLRSLPLPHLYRLQHHAGSPMTLGTHRCRSTSPRTQFSAASIKRYVCHRSINQQFSSLRSLCPDCTTSTITAHSFGHPFMATPITGWWWSFIQALGRPILAKNGWDALRKTTFFIPFCFFFQKPISCNDVVAQFHLTK